MSQTIHQTSGKAYLPRHLKRSQVEELVALADYLPSGERILIEHIFCQGMPIARISKLYQRPARHLQRQACSIIKRMSNNMFRFVALHMNTLPAETRATARHVVLHGHSLRETAQLTKTSLHHVRRHMNTVQATARLLA